MSALGEIAAETAPNWSKAERPLLISTDEIVGEIANWAVRQSPYGFPAGLEQALSDFRAAWPSDADMKDILPMRYWPSYGELFNALVELFETTPSFAAWGLSKNGQSQGIVGVSRYDKPDPDADSIDLIALAQNVARECWKDQAAEAWS